MINWSNQMINWSMFPSSNEQQKNGKTLRQLDLATVWLSRKSAADFILVNFAVNFGV
jgi:hypothetical protein